MVGQQSLGSGTYLVGEDELTARSADQFLVSLVGGSLVGYREGGHFLDLVTKKIDTDRVF